MACYSKSLVDEQQIIYMKTNLFTAAPKVKNVTTLEGSLQDGNLDGWGQSPAIETTERGKKLRLWFCWDVCCTVDLLM